MCASYINTVAGIEETFKTRQMLVQGMLYHVGVFTLTGLSVGIMYAVTLPRDVSPGDWRYSLFAIILVLVRYRTMAPVCDSSADGVAAHSYYIYAVTAFRRGRVVCVCVCVCVYACMYVVLMRTINGWSTSWSLPFQSVRGTFDAAVWLTQNHILSAYVRLISGKEAPKQKRELNRALRREVTAHACIGICMAVKQVFARP
jgi:hypothetical protein